MLGARAVIFASVGSMLPFDRFVKGVDDWALANPAVPVFLQIGDGAYEPRHCEWSRIVPQRIYQRHLKDCALFVAHVGMGSIMQALEARKQMLLMPRQASLREHTTEHQVHTAAKFGATPGLLIVEQVPELQSEMSRLIATPMTASVGIAPYAPDAMTNKIRAYLIQ